MLRSKRRLVALLCLLLVLTTGCSDRRILEEIAFTHTISYDLNPNSDSPGKRLLIGAAFPKANNQGKIQREMLTTEALTSKEARMKLSRLTELGLVSGQLRLVMFGKELAREGIWDTLSSLVRDPSTSPRVKVAIVDGLAHDLLVQDFPQHPRTGQYIDRMLEKEANKQTIPTVTLHHFTRELLDDPADPVAPIVRQRGNNVELSGIALFRKDRYVASVQEEDATVFSMIQGSFRKGELSMRLDRLASGEVQGRRKADGDEEVPKLITIDSMVNKRDMKVERLQGNRFKAAFKLEVTATLLEYSGDDIDFTSQEDRRKVEGLMSKYLNNRATSIGTLLKKTGADCVGIGERVRNLMSYKEWESIDWESMYPQTELDFDIQVRISNFGKFS
ncbi:Ger(x)C family spore germination protein [Paenibacillus koleovorans]|uniref:Ger(x)C family spore germination protein n=1 Tax=Paenibacillus koleovorans TaxID=121608 RepID=UPI000FDC5B6F|nr:Ger(x)C family spore germination protein [Paenibacillus koleovorans]